MLGIGEWLKINGEAIYGSRPWDEPGEAALRFTQGADGSFYIIALEWPGESLELATEVPVSDASVMTLLGSAAQPLAFSRSDQKLTIQMPASRAQEATQSQHAYVIRVSP
ncbi:MAG: alpha-L-fucosidase C-terminal domain-containing protein [Salinisphaeraceae bacterium]|nr:alpha-L-fucosidase C-terminal domain-containing protein [Salinisphaeraceae bacterium]